MDRVMVIGGPGSGKTWLAKELARCTGLPVIAIDDLVHDAAGQQRPPARIDADARAAADSSRWIIEGGNSRTYDYRAQRANCIVLPQPPLWKRLWRVWRRDGWNRPLLVWTWRYDRVFGPRDRAALAGAPDTVRKVVLVCGTGTVLASFAQPAPPHRPSA